jgi:hypothetical protein
MDVVGWCVAQYKWFFGIDDLEAKIDTLTAKVTAQEDLLYQTSKDKLQLAKEKIALQKDYDALLASSKADANVLNDRITELLGSVESLKTELAQQGVEVPSVRPEYIGTGFCYRPNIKVETEDISVPNPPDIYVRSDLLNRSLGVSSLRKLAKYQKVVKVWAFVIQALKYKYDVGDNWQVHPITIFRKLGDCEDGTILFVDACRACGISASEVFNSVGNTSFGYHSYPIIWFDSDEIKGTPIEGSGPGFYIFETTLDYVPDKPKKLNGSPYWVEGGIQNWLYFGSANEKFSSLFNGIKMPATGAGIDRKQRIDNSKLKRQRIIEFWRGK